MINYFKLTPKERIDNGYLKWSENWDILHNSTYYYHLIGIFRWLYKPLDFDKHFSIVKKEWRDCSQINHEKFYKRIETVKRLW